MPFGVSVMRVARMIARASCELSLEQTELDHADRHMHDHVQMKVRENLMWLCDHPEFAKQAIDNIKKYTLHLTGDVQNNGYIPKMEEWIAKRTSKETSTPSIED